MFFKGDLVSQPCFVYKYLDTSHVRCALRSHQKYSPFSSDWLMFAVVHSLHDHCVYIEMFKTLLPNLGCCAKTLVVEV